MDNQIKEIKKKDTMQKEESTHINSKFLKTCELVRKIEKLTSLFEK